MSIKKEPSGRRSVQVEVEVPGTPEEVWKAIATGPGISAWFLPTRMEERKGGEIVSNFGPGMDCPATITEWEALRRFVAESEIGDPGSPKVATEWSIEARAGGICVVRVVHSLFAGTDDWDDQLEGLELGWPTYFRILRRYLEDFPGMACSAMHFVSFWTDSESVAWQEVGSDLGLLNVAEGQTWRAPDGFPKMAGVVESLEQGTHFNTVLLHLDVPAPGSAYIGGFSCGGTEMVRVTVYLYGATSVAAAERDEPIWRKWMDERFPMKTTG